ncbi:hypothetical protein D9758_002332 [Tetrapyrgos nigripes]|uniref:Uncharacterized protein n=1 Tax=Tetrapyrgos nigripes TaxID=182062 RepID=A0A8H5LTB5_9AGAR|nr:hypothetical protein D9758_002332 [Tetrapyrgos nigripes]
MMATAKVRASMRLLEGRKEEWPEESEYYNISQADLPIMLDDPPAPTTTRASSLTLRNSIRSKSKVSLLPKLTFFIKKRSILDEFPQPPSHLPTPTRTTPSPQHAWPVDWPTIESESKGSTLQNRFKTLTTKIFARGRKDSSLPTPKGSLEYRRRRSSSLRALHSQSKAVPDSPVDEPITITYPIVNPAELTASPYSEMLPSARSSFVPPSPSWLSRNVAYMEPETPITPQSPLPLPIPPRILIQTSDTPPVSPFERTPKILITHTETPPLSPLEGTEGLLGTPGKTQGGMTGISRRSSWSEIKVGDTDFRERDLTRAFSTTTTNHVRLLLQPQPLKSAASLVVAKPLPATPSDWDIFIPSGSPADSNLPPKLRTLFSALCSEAGLFISKLSNIADIPSVSDFYNPSDNLHRTTGVANMDTTYGKRTDVVDAGGEYDYSGMQWFKDPPPARAAPAPEPVGTQYVPPPEVIEQNEAFRFALSAAPNVLYGRYKHYGQLGVLAWCSEFSELIDNLKDLGFAGNMFVSTRTQALKTCEDILRLHLEVKMQIIVLYLSSQVQRLRRFLDGDRVWDDYPEPSFPLDYTQYGK